MKCIALASGKGGVGKTLLTAAFGLALAEAGHAVLLVDGDMGLRNLDLVLGVSEKAARTSWDLAQGKCFEEDALISVRPGLDFLPASEKEEWKTISRHALCTVMEDLAPAYDYVLIDCPAGLGKGLRFAEEAADEWILVMGPSRASLRDAERTAEWLKGRRPLSLVCNNFRAGPEAAISWEAMADAAEGLPLLGVVPHSAEADRLAQEGRLADCRTDGAFREAVGLVLRAFLHHAAYPRSRWQALLRRAEEEEQGLRQEARPSGASALLRRQRRSAFRWRRR